MENNENTDLPDGSIPITVNVNRPKPGDSVAPDQSPATSSQNIAPSSVVTKSPSMTDGVPRVPTMSGSDSSSADTMGGVGTAVSTSSIDGTQPTVQSELSGSPVLIQDFSSTPQIVSDSSIMGVHPNNTSVAPAQADPIGPAAGHDQESISNNAQLNTQTAPTIPGSDNSRMRKLAVLAVGIAVFILGGSASAYFGYFSPRKPENMWRKSMSNTSRGIDKIVSTIDQAQQYKTLKVNGDFGISYTDLNVKGSFDSVTYGGNSQSQMVFGYNQDSNDLNINLDATVVGSQDSNYPDLYFKLRGMDSVKDQPSLQGILTPDVVSKIEDQWIGLLKEDYQDSATPYIDMESIKEDKKIEYNDTLKLTKESIATSNEYFFGSDNASSVISLKEFKGKKDGVYHYKAIINKDNVKAYIKSLNELIKESSLDSAVGLEDKDPIDYEDFEKSLDDSSFNDEFDVWVDSRAKVIKSIRFTDKNNENNYLELGLDSYTGGDKFPFYIKSENETDGQKFMLDLKLSVDTKTGSAGMQSSFVSTGTNGNETKIELSFSVERSNEDFNIEKPKSFISLDELLSDKSTNDKVEKLEANNDSPVMEQTTEVTNNNSPTPDSSDDYSDEDIDNIMNDLPEGWEEMLNNPSSAQGALGAVTTTTSIEGIRTYVLSWIHKILRV